MIEFPKAKALSLQELEQRRSPMTQRVVVCRAQVRGQPAVNNPCTSTLVAQIKVKKVNSNF